MQKIQQLEQKNSQLLKSAKQQQIYTENIMQRKYIIYIFFFSFYFVNNEAMVYEQDGG